MTPALPTDTEPSAEALKAAPWCRAAWFVLTVVGDGQGTSLHHGWGEICDAVVEAHYFRADADQRREILDRFTNFDDWQDIDHTPWQWCASYEDGFVTVERITDTAALDRFRAAEREQKDVMAAALREIALLPDESAHAAPTLAMHALNWSKIP